MKILSAEFVISAVGPKQFPADRRPQIAFAGRSNVGKSSIINALLLRKNLVKTSSTPGKTQHINFFIVNDALYFVDLPGYGYARAPQGVVDAWAPMIEGYLKGSNRLAAVVVLLDSRRGPDERDMRLVKWLRQYRIPAIYALTKADKVNRRESEGACRKIHERIEIMSPPVITSARTGQGIRELRTEIMKTIRKYADDSQQLTD